MTAGGPVENRHSGGVTRTHPPPQSPSPPPSPDGARWSGLETQGMTEAKCSLLLQEEVPYDAKIKALPRQRVLVYQDKGFSPETSSTAEDNFYVDFKGATILQLEPGLMSTPHKTMPVTLTVGGRCMFTAENYQDFRVMMRTRQQSEEMDIAPNGTFDWPDVASLLVCPCCGRSGPVPQANSRRLCEYWMVFYPLLQVTHVRGSQMTLGTRTICRLTCLDCMEDLLEGLTVTIQPGGSSSRTSNKNTNNDSAADDRSDSNSTPTLAPPLSPPPPPTSSSGTTRLCFTLPAADVLAEAGSASFLEDGPPRPETHPHVDDILDAWTLYNLWEHSGAWEALQNDYRLVLARSMHPDAHNQEANQHAGDEVPRLKGRMGKPCGNPACDKVHGRPDADGTLCRLTVKCRDCLSENYCSKACREAHYQAHLPDCMRKQRDREERREKKSRRVKCDTCEKKFPYTKMKKCSRCRKAHYCSVECQKADWENHRRTCEPV